MNVLSMTTIATCFSDDVQDLGTTIAARFLVQESLGINIGSEELRICECKIYARRSEAS